MCTPCCCGLADPRRDLSAARVWRGRGGGLETLRPAARSCEACDRRVAAMTSLLQVRNVAHRFRGLRVLKGVTFAVEEGSLTGLIGPNGAGKRTLFNIISRLLQPVGGESVYP